MKLNVLSYDWRGRRTDERHMYATDGSGAERVIALVTQLMQRMDKNLCHDMMVDILDAKGQRVGKPLNLRRSRYQDNKFEFETDLMIELSVYKDEV
jgi:hypothetical protein